MKNWKVAKKLLFSFGTLLVVILTLVCLSFVGVGNIIRQYQNFYAENYQGESNLYNLRLQMNLAVKNVALAVSATTDEEKNQFLSKAKEYAENTNKVLSWFETEYKGDKTVVLEYKNAIADAAKDRDNIEKLLSDDTDASYQKSVVVLEQYSEKADKAGALLAKMAQNLEESSVQRYEYAMRWKTTLYTIMVASLLIGTLIVRTMRKKMTKAILVPLKEIEETLVSASQGKLDVNVTYESKDEFGNVANSMRTFLESTSFLMKDQIHMMEEMSNGNFKIKSMDEKMYINDFTVLLKAMEQIKVRLSDTFSQIYEVAEQVASSSEQVSCGAQNLAQGATEQASSVEELAASMNEVSRQIESTAKISKRSNKDTLHIQKEADESNKNMQQMLAAMSDISENSIEISKIVKTIEDIAFQTNILSLNAAVEAARAGAAGKGFAVVADEVRNLANKSAEASKSTSALIERSLHSVERGKEITDKTATSLKEVIDNIHMVAESINRIAEDASTQANSVAQIHIGIDQIAGVVQTTSATSEESAASSEELSGQAQVLKELLSKFQWEDNNTTYATPMAQSMPTMEYANAPVPEYAPTVDISKQNMSSDKY